jgi:uncharacterized Zn finger protein (UPF0148 family)
MEVVNNFENNTNLCKSCNYPLRQSCIICPNCGASNITNTDENKLIKKSHNTNSKSLKHSTWDKVIIGLDNEDNETKIDNFIQLNMKRKAAFIEKVEDNIMVLRKLNYGERIKDGDILIENIENLKYIRVRIIDKE